MPKSTIARVRLVGMMEGASFLLLLGVAMPLKYAYDMPEVVRVVGLVHGLLWVAYLGTLVDARITLGWGVRRLAAALVASVLPCGPFVLDRRLRLEQAQQAGALRAPGAVPTGRR